MVNEVLLSMTTTYDENFAASGFLMFFVLALLLLTIVSYVITAFSLYKMAKNLGIDWAYAAWIPIANSALMVKIVQDKIHPSIREHAVIIYVGLMLFTMVFSIFSPIFLVASYYVIFLIFKQYSERYMIHFVISILTLQMSSLISFFMMRNRPAKNLKRRFENGI